MKLWLIINISVALIMATAQTCEAPRGHWYTMIRVEETSTGTVLTDVPYWREVSE